MHRVQAIGQRGQLQGGDGRQVQRQVALSAVEYDQCKQRAERHIDAQHDQQYRIDPVQAGHRLGIPGQQHQRHDSDGHDRGQREMDGRCSEAISKARAHGRPRRFQGLCSRTGWILPQRVCALVGSALRCSVHLRQFSAKHVVRMGL